MEKTPTPVSASEARSYFLFSPLLSQKWCLFPRTSFHAQLLQMLGYTGMGSDVEVYDQLSSHNMHGYRRNIILRLPHLHFNHWNVLLPFFLIHKQQYRSAGM